MTVLARKYRLGRRLAAGGMAEVYEAEIVGAAGFARKVAVKRMLGALSADPGFAEMFENEARLASLLHHPSVVAVLDFDRDDDGHPYLVMELVRGRDLRALADTGRLPVAVTAHIIGEVLRGLAYAHELVEGGKHLGIVHRDVSPHNIVLSWSGSVKIVDFGIAKAVAATNASRSGALKGKVAYMSPEQAHGGELDGRSDVFAVGVMFHELLTGARLFTGSTEAEILAHLLTQPIPRPRDLVADIPEELDHLCMAMVEREVGDRVVSARVAMENLRASPVYSTRASDDLRELLRARFPAQAPAEADLSGPVRLPTPAPGTPTPAQLHQSSGAMRGSTATAATVRNPNGASGTATAATVRGPSGASRTATPATARDSSGASRTATADTALAPGLAGGQATVDTAFAAGLPRGTAMADTALAPSVPALSPTPAAPASPRPRRQRRGAVIAAVLGLALAGAAVAGVLAVRGGQEGAVAATPVEGVEPTGSVAEAAELQVDQSPAAPVRGAASQADAGTRLESTGGRITAGGESESESEGESEGERERERERERESGGEGATSGDRQRDQVAARRRGQGTLKVLVEPWALVRIDGKSYGQTPVVTDVRAGVHRVFIEHDGFGKKETVRVRVRRGKTATVRRKWGLVY